MGLNNNRLLPVVLLLLPGILAASPKLRLSASTVGPVSIAQGANGAAQTVEAFNIGDSSLNLTLTSSVTWLGTSVGTQRACTTRSGLCTPLSFALNTSALPAGVTTGIVTVSDANALDAPQTITVTVQMGGSVPPSVDLYVAPGSSRQVTFSTNSPLTSNARTNDGGSWLSLALDGVGSFRFTYPYRIRVSPPASMPAGNYNGTVTSSGSTFAADNKSIGVTMRVTTQPIAVPATDHIDVALAQGSPKVTLPLLQLLNAGQGTLTIQSATASTETGGSWLTATSYNVGGLIPGGAAVTVDPASLAPGRYKGTVVFASNAVNGNQTVPVTLDIVPTAPPLVDFQGVLDNATFTGGDPVGRGEIIAVKGRQLSLKEPLNTSDPPLATQLADTQVLLNGSPLPLFYSSYGQINCLIPFEAPLGAATLQVKRTDQTGNVVSVDIADRAPRILRLGIGDYGVVVNQDGSFPLPVGSVPGIATRPAKAGDTLVFYAVGLGRTSPVVQTGAASPGLKGETLAATVTTPMVNIGGGIGGLRVSPLFTGLTPGYVGLYQINVTIPESAPKGLVDVTISFPDTVSNAVQIVIE